MRRVVFLAVDDEFAGLMQQYLYGAPHDWIVGSVISSSLLHRKNNFAAAVFLVRRSGCMYLAQMVKMKILRRLVQTGPVQTPTSLARKYGVEIYRTRDINN